MAAVLIHQVLLIHIISYHWHFIFQTHHHTYSPDSAVDGLADLQHGERQAAPALPQGDLEDCPRHAPRVLSDVVGVGREGEALGPLAPDVGLQEHVDLPGRFFQGGLHLFSSVVRFRIE